MCKCQFSKMYYLIVNYSWFFFLQQLHPWFWPWGWSPWPWELSPWPWELWPWPWGLCPWPCLGLGGYVLVNITGKQLQLSLWNFQIRRHMGNVGITGPNCDKFNIIWSKNGEWLVTPSSERRQSSTCQNAKSIVHWAGECSGKCKNYNESLYSNQFSANFTSFKLLFPHLPCFNNTTDLSPKFFTRPHIEAHPKLLLHSASDVSVVWQVIAFTPQRRQDWQAEALISTCHILLTSH